MPGKQRPQNRHWLPGNKSEWSPPTVIFLDTETKSDGGDPVEILSLRLWVAALFDRRIVRQNKRFAELGYGKTDMELARWIDGQFVGRRTIWLYAHNLSFDAITTRLPESMLALGWSLASFSTFGKSPWFKFRRGTKSLTVTDSWSWLPQALRTIGDGIGHNKGQLPADDASEEDWLRYCCNDVDVLQRAVLELMQWWDDNKLGHWSSSGAATGFNAMRHMCQGKQIVIDPDPEARAFERESIYGGRRDATRHGPVIGGPFVHIDFAMAHATCAANLPLPIRRHASFTGLDIADKWLDEKYWGIVARVTINTDRPYYPVRWEREVVYPVGRFKTVLCGPDILEARRRGHLEAIGPGYWHRLGNTLQPWGKWIISVATGQDRSAPYVARVAAKAWSRSAPGKFASHTSTERPYGDSWGQGWQVQDAWSVERRRRATIVDTGKERKLIIGDLDADQSYPAVFAWLESLTRVRLSRILEYVGEDAWVQCDTDGAILDMRKVPHTSVEQALIAYCAGNPALEAELLGRDLADMTWPLVARPKETYRAMDIAGPQQMFFGGRYKLSGIPNGSEQVFPRVFRGTVWPKYASQASAVGQQGYRIEHRTFIVAHCTIHRWVTTSGSTSPIKLTIGDDGSNQIEPYPTLQTVGTAGEPIMLQWLPLRKYL